jgi:iron complex outermembrane receptor protein
MPPGIGAGKGAPPLKSAYGPDAISVIGNEAPQIARCTINLGAQYARAGERQCRCAAPDRRPPHGPDVLGAVQPRLARSARYRRCACGADLGGVSVTAFASNLFDETYNAEFSPGGFVFPLIATYC